MESILVTGGAGFIGSHIVDQLVKQKYHVSVIDDLSGGKLANINAHATFYKCDLRQTRSLQTLMAIIKPRTIYHLAANAAENKAQFSPVDITSRNYDAAIKILTAGINTGMKRFIFTSSIAVYGALQTPFRESDRPEPEDLYGITKLAFERTLKVMSEVHGFESVIVRPHNVYGPRQNMSDPYRNVVTIFMNQLLKQEPLTIYGDGQQKRCFSYIDDVVNILIACHKQPVSGLTFNVGTDVACTIDQLAQAVIKVSQTPGQITYLPARLREVAEAISDHSLSHQHFGHQTSTDLTTGLTETWNWARSQGHQKLKFTKIEIDSPHLPQNWKRD